MLLAALLAAASPQACTLESARPATVREMAAAPDEWLGRCVRLDGFTVGYTFYEDLAALYRYGATDGEDRPNEGWLGLYFLDKRANRGRTRWASVAGVVHDCERDYEASAARAASGEFIMAVGYCHYQGGLILTNVAARHGKPAVLPRATGEKARIAFGDLMTVQEAGEPPAEARRLVQRFAAAVRAGDPAGADAVADSYDQTIGEGSTKLARWRAFLTSRGPFAHLLAGRGGEPAYFKARISRKVAERGDIAPWFACFCTTSDCAQGWPIAASDATADFDPAYACVRLYRKDRNAAEPWELGVETIWGFEGRR